MSRSPEFEAFIRDCIDLHRRKDSDYAGDSEPYSNFMSSVKFGLRPDLAIMVRLSDKYHRVKTLLAKERSGEIRQVLDESISDTLKDLFNYAGIFIVVRNRLRNMEDTAPSWLRILIGHFQTELTFESVLDGLIEDGAPDEEGLDYNFDNLCTVLFDAPDDEYSEEQARWLMSAAAGMFIKRSKELASDSALHGV